MKTCDGSVSICALADELIRRFEAPPKKTDRRGVSNLNVPVTLTVTVLPIPGHSRERRPCECRPE